MLMCASPGLIWVMLLLSESKRIRQVKRLPAIDRCNCPPHILRKYGYEPYETLIHGRQN